MSDSTSQAYFSADFGEHGGRFDWSNHEQIAAWITQVRDQWSWIAQQQNDPCIRTWKVIAAGFNAPNQALAQAHSHKNQGQTQQAQANLDSARSSLEAFVRAKPWLLSNSARKSFVDGLRESGQPLEAALIVANWMEQDFSGAPIRQVINALLTWELYERGIKDRMKAESSALKRLAGDMQTTLTQFQESERTQATRFDELHLQLSAQTTTQQGSFVDSQAQRDEKWQELLSGVQGELQNLKDTYDKHMALAAPVEYWDTKRKRHNTLSIVSFFAVIVCMLLVGWLLHTELQTVASGVLQAEVSTAAGQTAATNAIKATLQPTTAWHLGSFLLLATLSFWFIRLLVRIFLSNLHLENDAAERVTMAKTYLALLRDGSLPKDNSINTVLAALFRPTGDGIVKDEGLPPTAMEWITKLGGK